MKKSVKESMRRTGTPLIGGALAAMLSPALVALLLASPAPARELDLAPPAAAATCTSCGKETYGTTVEWSGSPSEAAREAREAEKLVFVLHVSGHFEDEAFT